MIEDFNTAQSFPASCESVEYRQLKPHLMPKWKTYVKSIERKFDDPKFGNRTDVLPSKSRLKRGGGLQHGQSIDNEALWCSL